MKTKYIGGRTQLSRNVATGLTQEQRRELHYARMDAYKRQPTQKNRTVHTKAIGQ